ncbi:MAG: hypothetical protein HZB16_07535 [Armatimonadetes bacterium]|nr:hypothetical protein [Armatimonadota bacterium]
MRDLLLAIGLVSLVVCISGCVTEEQKHLTPTEHGKRTTTYGKALDRAEDSACEQYLGQLNQAVTMYASTNEKYPPDLAAVIKESGLPASELKNCKYVYDPATGKVALVR